MSVVSFRVKKLNTAIELHSIEIIRQMALQSVVGISLIDLFPAFQSRLKVTCEFTDGIVIINEISAVNNIAI